MLFHFGAAQESTHDAKEKLNLSHLVLLNQTHSIDDQIITEKNKDITSRSMEGDFLITHLSRIGLAVLTADCLPIVFYDIRNSVVGIAHAGWRGSINNIAAEVVSSLQKNYGTNSANLSVLFGPCAHKCCYQVKEDFLPHLASFAFGNNAIVKRNGNLFFDQLFFNKQLLLSLGLHKDAIVTQQSLCTICNHNYFSYRRQGMQAGRQVNIVSLQ